MRGRLAAIGAMVGIFVVVGVGSAVGAYVLTGKARAGAAPGAAGAHGMVASHKAGSGAAHPGHGMAESTAIWQALQEGNQRFVDGDVQERELVETREGLAQSQHPKVIVLTCSDSRLSPELIFDQNLGDLFVIRTAGNIADRVGLGSIEYAAEHLHASLLIVLGHEKCGAVAAAASGQPMPSPNLAAIVNQITPALTAIQAPAGSDQRADLGVPANVRQSARDLLQRSPLLKNEVAHGKLAIVQAVYKLKSGEVVRL
jgi:carbonic anhydrase